MKYFVVEPFTIETQQGSVNLPAGKILELLQDQAARLGGKVKQMHPNGGRDLQHYCTAGQTWCSSKLPEHLNPTTCQKCHEVIAEPPDGDNDHCKFWRQVCHAVGMYQEQSTGTGDAQCSVFRLLELNTYDNRKLGEI